MKKKKAGDSKRKFLVRKGDHGIALESELVSGKGAKAVYKYKIKLDNGKFLENVPRDNITTYRVKDDTILKDILNARQSYKDVVEHLNRLFSPIEFVE